MPEFPSFLYFLLISLIPSVLILGVYMKFVEATNVFVVIINSFIVGLAVSFCSLMISMIVDKFIPISEILQMDLIDLEGLQWFIILSGVSSIILTPVTFLWIKVSNNQNLFRFSKVNH